MIGLSAFILFLNPLARLLTRATIARMTGFSGTFSDARFSLLRLRYEVDDLQLFAQHSDGKRSSFFSANSIEVRLSGRDLLGARLVGWVEIDRAKATIDLTSWLTPFRAPSQLDELCAQLPPMRIIRLALSSSEAVVRDVRRKPADALQLRDLQLSIENVATRRGLAEKRPTLFDATATFERSGRFELLMTADLTAELLTFVGNARFRSFDLDQLRELLLVAAPDIKLPSGQFDLDVAVTCDRGRSHGGIRPTFREVDRHSVDRDLGRRLKAALSDRSLHLVAETLPDRGAAALLIPFRADLSVPNVRLGPTLLSLLRNAVIEGLAQGLVQRPRQPTPHRELLFREARRAPRPKEQRTTE
jgi:hypothetical protein